MYCIKCGSPVPDNWQFCTKCGAPAARNIPDRIQAPEDSSGAPPGIGGEIIKSRHLGIWFYGLGASILVISGTIAAVLLVIGLFDIPGLFHAPGERFAFPGTHEIQIDSTGEYTVFYEYRSTVDGVAYRTSEYIPDLRVRLKSKTDLQEIDLSSTSGSHSYTIGSRAGTSLFDFNIDQPGVYILTAEYQDASTTPKVVLAIGPSLDIQDILGILVPSLPIGFGGFVLGAIIILLGFIMRRKVHQQIAALQKGMISPKSRLAVTLLAYFLGGLGGHRFYLEKYMTAVLMLLTCGGLGIWALVDVILALSGEMKDDNGRYITKWQT